MVGALTASLAANSPERIAPCRSKVISIDSCRGGMSLVASAACD